MGVSLDPHPEPPLIRFGLPDVWALKGGQEYRKGAQTAPSLRKPFFSQPLEHVNHLPQGKQLRGVHVTAVTPWY